MSGTTDITQDLTKRTSPVLNDELILVNSETKAVQAIKLDAVRNLLAAFFTGAVVPQKINAGAVLGTPAEVQIYYAPAGSYTTPTGVVNLTGNLNMWFWNKVVWSYMEIPVAVDLSMYALNSAVALKADTLSVVAKNDLYAGQNQYDYLQDVDGFYIDATNGTLTTHPTSSVSKKIPVIAGDILYILNRTGSTEVRFLDVSDNPLKALQLNGTPFASYAGQLNGGFKAPVGAVNFQFTTRFVGTTNRNNTILSSSPTGQITIKPILVPKDQDLVSLQTVVTQNTADLVDTVRKSVVFYGANQYKYLNDIEGYYITSTTGVLSGFANCAVSEVLPITAGKIVYLFNRTGQTEFRFVDAGGNPLKPLDVNDVPFTLYSGRLNGAFKAPVGAVGYQFTTKFTGTTNRTNIVASFSQTGSVYVKDEYLNPALIAEVAANTAGIATIQGQPIPKRVNTGEDTTIPNAFPPATETSIAFKIEVVPDLDSPTAGYATYKRVFSNTLAANYATCYRTWLVPLGAQRPTTVSFAFWAKKSEFDAIFTTFFQTFLGSRVYSVNPALVIAGTEQTGTPSSSTTEYSAATMKMAKIAETSTYYRFRISFKDIVWNGGFVGTTILYYFSFGGSAFLNKSMDLVDFTCIFGEDVKGTTIYGDPNGDFPSNVSTIPSLQADISALSVRATTLETSTLGTCKVLFRNNRDLYFSSPFDATRNFVRKWDVFRPQSFAANPNANLIDERFASKSGDQTALLTSIKGSSDDICPANVNGSYVGGNHGWAWAKILVLGLHGKTLSDVGNVYTASGKQYVILRVVDANNLWICARNEAVDGFTYTFTSPVGDLVYTSGDGANQSTMSGYAINPLGNLYGGSISVADRKILLDGVTEVTANGDYSCNFCDIVESYDVLDLTSIVQKLIDNRPIGGYLTQPYFNELGADKLFNHSIVYRMLANGTTLITHNFRTYKKLKINFHGFIQAGALATGSLTIPKSLPISDGVKTWDFRKLENWAVAPASSLYLNNTYWEKPLSPPDRLISKDGNVVFHMGYVTDRGIESSRKDVVYNSIYLYTSRKLYPFGVSPAVAATLEPNTFYSAVCFRQFMNVASNPAGRTNFSHFQIGETTFVYLDYHASIEDSIIVPTEWVGKKIEVVEKTANVLILGDVVSGKLTVSATIAADGYGYAVLKLV